MKYTANFGNLCYFKRLGYAFRHSATARVTRCAATPGLHATYLEKMQHCDALSGAINSAMCHRQSHGATGDRGRHAGCTSDSLTTERTYDSESGPHLQRRLLNFYESSTSMPYTPLSALGPWIVTVRGGVVYDVGGYGMLGFGHNPRDLLRAMSTEQVMANVMTPSLVHEQFSETLRRHIGSTRQGGCPYSKWTCLNSGSEANSLAMRIADAQALRATSSGGAHENRRTVFVGLAGSFHGRTDRPAQASDSSATAYQSHLNSYRHWKPLYTVPVNDVQYLRRVWQDIYEHDLHVEMMLMEPVMGEGNPGVAITREFYDAARELTLSHGSLLLVDSVQAGLRCHGCLSVLDYPGVQDAVAPDFETFSKALHGGQFPLSVLAVGPRAVGMLPTGVYGNTMACNPRGMHVAVAALRRMTPELRRNIVTMGRRMKAALRALQRQYPNVIHDVTGVGLLLAVHMKREFPVLGDTGLEATCRRMGLGVIHGGANALRFTPHFSITEHEIALVCDVVSDAIESCMQTRRAKKNTPQE